MFHTIFSAFKTFVWSKLRRVSFSEMVILIHYFFMFFSSENRNESSQKWSNFLRALRKTTTNWQSLCEVSPISDDWSNPDSEHTRSSTLTWMLLTSVTNMHGSVNNLLTLLLLEQSPKTVDLLLDEGNEGTVGRMLGSKDPHSPVFPAQVPSVCRCLFSYFLAPCDSSHIQFWKSQKQFKRQFEFQTLV